MRLLRQAHPPHLRFHRWKEWRHLWTVQPTHTTHHSNNPTDDDPACHELPCATMNPHTHRRAYSGAPTAQCAAMDRTMHARCLRPAPQPSPVSFCYTAFKGSKPTSKCPQCPNALTRNGAHGVISPAYSRLTCRGPVHQIRELRLDFFLAQIVEICEICFLQSCGRPWNDLRSGWQKHTIAQHRED